MNKLLALSVLFLLPGIYLSAQDTGIKGKVISASAGTELSGVSIQVTGISDGTVSLADGSFTLLLPSEGDYEVILSMPGYETTSRLISAMVGTVTDIGTIELPVQLVLFQDIPTINFNENEDDTGMSSQNIIALMGGSQDVYLSESAFKFGAVRFFVRGFDNEYTHTYINGVNFNDQIRGRFNYSMIGGLNDATRNKDVSNGLGVSGFGFGDLGGVSNINARASGFNKGGRATLSVTNRNYKLRGMVTHSTGLMENGWALTTALGYRWADEGYVEGTFYNSFAYFLSAEKVFGVRKQHSLSFTTFGVPTQRGQQAASYQEIYDILDNNYYNPNWGYQNGEKRNSRVATSFDPVAVLSHLWKINNHSTLTTGIGARYNQYGTTALNWYNSADPRPDYYRYLPSYQGTDEMKELYTQLWKTSKTTRQVDWDRLYNVNRLSREQGESARYMLEERHSDLMELTLNSTFNTKPTNNQNLTIGIEMRTTKGLNFKTVNDLLGAEYWLDVDQFAERDFPGNPDVIQNDVNNPNRQVKVGDKFGYDYDVYVNSANIWLQNEYNLPRVDLFYALKLSYTEFQRDGNMRNGRAVNNSFGKGDKHEFVNQAVKAGITYKLTGRHFIVANAMYETRAPLPFNSYLSARIKDTAIPELKSERVASADLGYVVSTPKLRGRLSVYKTNFFDQNELNSFYHDSYRTFVNYVMTDIRKVHQGVEMGLVVNLTSQIRLKAVGTIAEYRYTNRPTGYTSYENGSRPDTTETVYLRNFYVGGTPQTAGSIGLAYNHPKYWFFEANYNYFDRIYVDATPIRRTLAATSFTATDQEDRENRVKAITEQEKYKDGGTLDVSIGKSLRLKGGYFLSLNLSVNNLLDNTDLRSGGYEQGRFDFETFNVEKFPSKYYYAQGRNFFLNVGLRF